MASERLPLYLFVGIGLLSVFYQTIGRDIWVQTGIGNTIHPISDFPYTCRRLRDPGLEACEDMWLSERTRQLFLACSDAAARKDWLPNIHRLNATARSQTDKLIVLDIDKPNGQGFQQRIISTTGYTGINGDGKWYLVAVNGVDYPDHIDLYLNNNRPSINTKTGELLNNEETGANSTIELFRIDDRATASVARHIKTFADPQIATPNRVAPTGSGSFYFTNDHGVNRVGLWHHLSPFVKSGDVSFCSAEGQCKRVDKGHAIPNGLLLGRKDGLLYVPSTSSGTITVYRPEPDGSVKVIDRMKVGYPLDNMSEDDNGEYWVAGFPKLLEALPAFDDPLAPSHAPSAIFRIKRRTDGKKGYIIQKALEDHNGEVLPMSTVAVHDAKTGRIFLGGVVSPFITVCDPK